MTLTIATLTLKTPHSRVTAYFFAAFKKNAAKIIERLRRSNTADGTFQDATAQLSAEIGREFVRLQYIIQTMIIHIQEDKTWAIHGALRFFEFFAMAVDPGITHPHDAILKGGQLVHIEMIETLENCFAPIIAEPQWNRGFIDFLGSLCSDKITMNLTSRIAMKTIDRMVVSQYLFKDDNFEILLRFLVSAEPFIDLDPCLYYELDRRFEHLMEVSKECNFTQRLSLHGVLRLREKHWRLNVVEIVHSHQ